MMTNQESKEMVEAVHLAIGNAPVWAQARDAIEVARPFIAKQEQEKMLQEMLAVSWEKTYGSPPEATVRFIRAFANERGLTLDGESKP